MLTYKSGEGGGGCEEGMGSDVTRIEDPQTGLLLRLRSHLPSDKGMALYTASKPGLWMVESVIRLISMMLPDDVTSRGLEGGLCPHFLQCGEGSKLRKLEGEIQSAAKGGKGQDESSRRRREAHHLGNSNKTIILFQSKALKHQFGKCD